MREPSADAESRRISHMAKIAHLEDWEHRSLESGYSGAPVTIAPASVTMSGRMTEVIPFYGVFVTRQDAINLAWHFGLPEGIDKAIKSDVQVLLIEPDNYDNAQRELNRLLEMHQEDIHASPI